MLRANQQASNALVATDEYGDIEAAATRQLRRRHTKYSRPYSGIIIVSHPTRRADSNPAAHISACRCVSQSNLILASQGQQTVSRFEPICTVRRSVVARRCILRRRHIIPSVVSHRRAVAGQLAQVSRPTDRPTDVKLGARRSPRAQLLIKYSRKASRYGAATDGQMRESDTSVQSASSISLYVQHNSATWLRKWQTVLFSDCDRHTAINNEMANDKWQSSSNAITNNFVEASSFLTENWLNKKLGYCRETAQRSVSHRSQSPNKIRLTWVKYDVTGDLKST